MQLYVDRRGSPYNKQMLFFDLQKKIDFLYEIVSASKKCSNSIYITEFNWPLANTAPYAPTSEKECVAQDKAAQFIKEYFTIAKQTNKIEKVFFHQLVAPGYGLIDYNYKKHIAFDVVKQIL